jgi:two-component system LytT family response regulator
MPLTTLIVDDEPLARDGLRMLLSRDPDIDAIHEARNGREAVEFLQQQSVDLLFLDVQMPDLDGFGVVREIGAGRLPDVVFVTAHDKYAIQAFEINALDYLLKPVTADRFAKALQRAKVRLGDAPVSATNHRQILSLLETIASPRKFLHRLAVRSGGRTVFVDVNEIEWMQAAENYVELHVGGAVHLLRVPIGTLEASLDPELFVRIHRSLILNIGRIQDLQPAFHGEYAITMKSGVRLQSGRLYNEKIRALTANRF